MSYAALWCREGSPVVAGKAIVKDGFLLLTGVDRHGSESRERLPLGELGVASVARGRHERLQGRPALVLITAGGPTLRLAVLEGGGTLHELAGRLSS